MSRAADASVTTPAGQLVAEQRANRLLVLAVYALTGVVGVVVLAVSSYYLHEYGSVAGMTGWLAWTLVVALDVGGVAGALCWVVSDGPARAWGRGIAAGNLAASVLGNIIGHILGAGGGTHSPGPWLQILTGAAYPAELAAMVHLALVFRAERGARHPATIAVPAVPELPAVPDKWSLGHVPKPVPARRRTQVPTGTPRDLLALAQALRADLLAQGKPAGREALRAGLTDDTGKPISDRTARDLIRQLNTDPALTSVPAVPTRTHPDGTVTVR